MVVPVTDLTPASLARLRAIAEPLAIDPEPLLRARPRDEQRRARRVVRCRDGWLAVNLPRADDVASLSAWLEHDVPLDLADAWPVVEDLAGARATRALVDRAVLLGLPVAALGETAVPVPSALGGLPVRAERVAVAGQHRRVPRVVNLASLWAGPLCARLLADRGATVVKVESSRRPDAARTSGDGLFERLNAGVDVVSLDLDSAPDLTRLRALCAGADVVIEGSRPRALRQLGIDAREVLRAHEGPSVWLSITGYGRAVERVAFGDDAAFAGGLVRRSSDGTPDFAGTALADPLAGIAAASAAVTALDAGGRWLVDVAMAGVAAHVAAGSVR